MTMDPTTPKVGHESSPPTTTADGAFGGSDGRECETPKMAHDSMVTVRLSEPPLLSLETNLSPEGKLIRPATAPSDETTINEPASPTPQRSSVRDSSSTLAQVDPRPSLGDELEHGTPTGEPVDSDEDEEVNWEKLEKKEDEEAKDDDNDSSTNLLLARLEQENAKLATNPKSVKVKVAEEIAAATRPRPPSMAQLQHMVNEPTPSALRYSMLPPPPMTDLEFYAALVKDYQQTAARLPTLLSNKIRKGIPPPLRGVVWQSMSSARDIALEEQYGRYADETSPYELIIGKDLGRSFPGVEMFRDPEGDGQRMLGKVLKAFSLYDTKIGYCQGLAFLVGPLLMHMPDQQAFCVLVRLMEQYDLRTCFLPDLSGLHVRIYQFRELLRHNLPELSSHLEDLQVDPAYVSQWFLSFFAVTCPLPMVFRIYDVLFAEGSSETLMRVALSLMRKNESRLLSCTELEDVMQLLLSRGLWDCYHYDADEFVDDFVDLTNVVSREKLAQLEQDYRQSLIAAANVTRSSDITTAASRFLGRIWATSTNMSPKTAAPTNGLAAPARPLSMLRRTTSKQSLASTLNSVEASSASIGSSISTEASTVSRGSSQTEEEPSSRESTPVGKKVKSMASMKSTRTVEDRYLHSQIEDLLTALSELQRNHTALTNQLQIEREQRMEDAKAVHALLDGLKRTTSSDSITTVTKGDVDGSPPAPEIAADASVIDRADEVDSAAELPELIQQVERRFRADEDGKRVSEPQSKTQLRDDLTMAKNQLGAAMSQSQDLNRKINDLNQEIGTLKDQLKESHAHVRGLHQDKQRLEKHVHGLKARSSACSAVDASGNSRELDVDWAGGKAVGGGLRELKLARSKSSPTQPGSSMRLSSLPVRSNTTDSAISDAMSPTTEHHLGEHDTLLLELVQAKTAEAVARQEAEEAKQKLEALRKTCGLSPGEAPPPLAAAANAAATVFGRLTGQAATAPAAAETASKPATPASNTNSGGFWGWRR